MKINQENKAKRLYKTNGFTMIELLVVIVILGILSVIGLGSFRSSQIKARDSKRKSDIKNIGEALEIYYNDFGQYPVADGAGGMMACGVDAQELCVANEIWHNSTNNTTYMVQLPEDPSGGKYYYKTSPTGNYYQIYAHLENDQDRDVPTDADGAPVNYVNPEVEEGSNACLIGDCNYGRSSTNTDLGLTF